MRFPLRWLREYVDVPEPAEEIASLLTNQGLEVSSMSKVGPEFSEVLSCRIVSAEALPGSDRLWVCRVDTGQAERQVVCAAPNVATSKGACAPLALPGARLPGGRIVQATEVRGVLSDGMLCSEAELGLAESSSGIFVLPEGIGPGRDLGEALALDDVVLDVEVTPNRPDCLCVVGIAREIAAAKGRRLRLPDCSVPEEGPKALEIASVEIRAPDLCFRYVARVLVDLRVGPSPFWLRRWLSLAGLRPINNIVDATNFVMWELGQPLHAFDLDRLEERRIVVRRAETGETLTTLDGVRRSLAPEDLVICDAARPVALAGVMGGQESEIQGGTARVLLESAFFEPRGIRRTGKRHGLSTEASYRFEREVDLEGALRAADRAAGLMRSLAGGRVLAGAVDVYPRPYRARTIRFSVGRANRLLGTSIDRNEMRSLLERLSFSVRQGEEDFLEVEPPSFRPDVREPADLAEEIARLYGYGRIPVRMPVASLAVPVMDPEKKAEEAARDLLVSRGFQEAVQYSFVPRDRIERMGFPEGDPRGRPVPLQNPLSEAQAVLRTTLVSSLLDLTARNLRKNNSDLRLFELRRVFLRREDSDVPEQKRMLAAVMTGRRFPQQWNQPADRVDAYDLKGLLEALFDAFGVSDWDWVGSGENSSLHPGCSGDILIRNTRVGFAGRLHPRLQKELEIHQDVYLFELEFQHLVASRGEGRSYRPIGRFPAIQRDLAFVLSEEIPYREVMEQLRASAAPEAVRIELFDVYRGSPVPEGRKSMAFRITYQHPERTLTDEEVNALQERLLDQVLPRLKAHLR